MQPYETRAAAQYWGGGVIMDAAAGGYWSLHAFTTPTGIEKYYCGRTGRADGWPPEASGRYGWRWPEGGGPKCICVLAQPRRTVA